MKNILCIGFVVGLLSCCNFGNLNFKSPLDDAKLSAVHIGDKIEGGIESETFNAGKLTKKNFLGGLLRTIIMLGA